MNHLCHLFLTGHDHHLLLGNLIADFIKPIDVSDFPDEVQSGIRLHQFIDSTVDTHETFKSSIALLRPTQGKYAPVVADMLYDYLLTSHWDTYSDRDFNAFKGVIYGEIMDQTLLLKNEFIKKRVLNMVANDFLSSYISPSLIPQTFSFLQRRAKFENQFDQAYDDFIRLQATLSVHFSIVFQDMIQKTEDYRLSLRS